MYQCSLSKRWFMNTSWFCFYYVHFHYWFLWLNQFLCIKKLIILCIWSQRTFTGKFESCLTNVLSKPINLGKHTGKEIVVHAAWLLIRTCLKIRKKEKTSESNNTYRIIWFFNKSIYLWCSLKSPRRSRCDFVLQSILSLYYLNNFFYLNSQSNRK